MSNLHDFNEILDFAIRAEQKAHDFYMRLAGNARNSAIRKMLEGFAAEELGHKAKLIRVKEGKRFVPCADKPITDLKIADYIVATTVDDDADYQDVLIYAMQSEKAAFKLYTDLAASTDNPELKALLLGLAQEEAKHKLRFEIEYDDNILTEN